MSSQEWEGQGGVYYTIYICLFIYVFMSMKKKIKQLLCFLVFQMLFFFIIQEQTQLNQHIFHYCSSVKIQVFYLSFANSRIFHHQAPLLATIWINTHEYIIKCRVKKQKAGKMVLLINTQHSIEKLCLWKAHCKKPEMAKKKGYQVFCCLGFFFQLCAIKVTKSFLAKSLATKHGNAWLLDIFC